jgi:hypothetical membrane protein
MRKTALWSGIAGIGGCVAAIAADAAAIRVVDGYDPISQTISDLAAGPHAWIEDTGLVALGVGILFVAGGLLDWRRSGRRWLAGTLTTALMGAVVVVLALHDAYGARPADSVVHMTLVRILGGLFFASALLLARDLGRNHGWWPAYSRILAFVWLLLAVPFFFLPTDLDGAYERGLALLVMAWLVGASLILIRRGTR